MSWAVPAAGVCNAHSSSGSCSCGYRLQHHIPHWRGVGNAGRVWQFDMAGNDASYTSQPGVSATAVQAVVWVPER